MLEVLLTLAPVEVLLLVIRGDKGYCVNPAKTTLKRKGCHDATIKKATMKGKDAKKDGWLSAMRSPYEPVFAHRNRRVRYRGLQKVQFQPGIRALTFNLKRVITLDFENINLLPAQDKSALNLSKGQI